MGKFFMVIVTLLVLVIIGTINSKNNKRLIVGLMKLLLEINKTYIVIFTQKSIISRITETGMIISAQIFACISVVISAIRYFQVQDKYSLDMLLIILIAMCSIIVIYFSIGYMLLVSSRIHTFFSNVEDKNIRQIAITN